MNQTPKKDQQRYGATTIKTPMKKGLFADGMWYCDCEPRMPAEHFETKNGGRNHGRWFYTCQKPQPRRCGFFLWDSDAKTREAHAVLANSRTEPPTSEATMSGTIPVRTPQTPQSASRSVFRSDPFTAARSPTGPKQVGRDDDWQYLSDDDLEYPALAELADTSSDMPSGGPASKSAKNNVTDSPSKRNREDYQEQSGGRPVYQRPTADLDLFNTPATGRQFNTPNTGQRRGLFPGTQTNPQARDTNQIGGLLSPGDTSRTNRLTDIYDDLRRVPAARDESPTARKSTNLLASNSKLTESLFSPEPAEEDLRMTPLAKQILDALKDEAPEMTDNSTILNSVKSIALKNDKEFEDIKRELKNMTRSRDGCRVIIDQKKKQIEVLEAKIAKLEGSARK